MKAQPYVCPICTTEPENYYGRLVFPGETETPVCPNHKDKKVRLTPANGEIE